MNIRLMAYALWLMAYGLFDTHCHIHFKGLDAERAEILRRCEEKRMLLNLVGTQKDTSRQALELARTLPYAYASLGTHPNHLFPTYLTEEESSFMTREEDFDESYYEALYQTAPDKVIAMGETGIDLFHIPADVPLATILGKQRQVFLDHAAFARRHDLALVIHVRDGRDVATHNAHQVMIELLGQPELRPQRKVIHCYTTNWHNAKQYLELGCYLGFTGIITYPIKKTNPREQGDLWEVVKHAPLDRMVIETDAPYLAPQQYRGKRSEPWMCAQQIRFIAELRGEEPSVVEQAVFENALRLFNLTGKHAFSSS